MLTPIDIQNHSLKTAVRGYSKKETDDFLEEIIKSYEEVYRENRELKDKLSSLSDGIQYYKGMESTLQKALVLAEKTSSETQEAAKSKADALTSEAETKAEALVKEAKAKAEAIEAEANAYAEVEKSKANQELEETRNHVRKLVQSYENYRLQFKKLAESQIEMLESEHFSIFAPELNEMLGEDAPNADEAMEAEETVAINSGISSRGSSRNQSEEEGIARAEQESIATAFQGTGDEERTSDAAVTDEISQEGSGMTEDVSRQDGTFAQDDASKEYGVTEKDDASERDGVTEKDDVSEGDGVTKKGDVSEGDGVTKKGDVSEGDGVSVKGHASEGDGVSNKDDAFGQVDVSGQNDISGEDYPPYLPLDGMKTVEPQNDFSRENGTSPEIIQGEKKDEGQEKEMRDPEAAGKTDEARGEDSPFEFIDPE